MMSRLLLLILPLFFLFSLPSVADALTCERHSCTFQNAVCCEVEGQSDSFCATQSQCTGQGGTVVAGISTPPPPAGAVGSPAGGAGNNTVNSVGGGSGLINPLKVNSVPEFLNLVLQAVVQLGTVLLILMLVYVGFLFVVAQGSEEKLQNAKKALMWTVIGGLILLGAQAISLVIEQTVNSLR